MFLNPFFLLPNTGTRAGACTVRKETAGGSHWRREMEGLGTLHQLSLCQQTVTLPKGQRRPPFLRRTLSQHPKQNTWWVCAEPPESGWPPWSNFWNRTSHREQEKEPQITIGQFSGYQGLDFCTGRKVKGTNENKPPPAWTHMPGNSLKWHLLLQEENRNQNANQLHVQTILSREDSERPFTNSNSQAQRKALLCWNLLNSPTSTQQYKPPSWPSAVT